jgi:glycosyltransferase involved in cell wall biosynthesis
VVSDQETGFLIDRGDTKALADRVLTLMLDPERRSIMGATGRKKVESVFDLRKNVTQLLEAYGISESTPRAEGTG